MKGFLNSINVRVCRLMQQNYWALSVPSPPSQHLSVKLYREKNGSQHLEKFSNHLLRSCFKSQQNFIKGEQTLTVAKQRKGNNNNICLYNILDKINNIKSQQFTSKQIIPNLKFCVTDHSLAKFKCGFVNFIKPTTEKKHKV